MTEAWEWLRQRWYWVAGAILGLLLVYLYLHRSSAAAASTGATAVSDPNAAAATAAVEAANAQSGAAVQVAQLQAQGAAASAAAQAQSAAAIAQSQSDAAVQVAQVQAQSAAAIANAQAGASLQTAQLALAQQQDIDAANLGIAVSGNNSAVAINAANNAAAVQLGTAQTNAAVQLGQIQGNTQVQLGAQQAYSAVTLGAQQADVAKYNDDAAIALQNGVDATNLATTISNNQTQLAAYGIQAGVANNAITTAGNVDLASTAAQEAEAQQYYAAYSNVSAAQLQAQQNNFNTAASILASGILNKGGEGGLVQQTAFSALVNAPQAAAVSAGAAGNVGVAQAQSTANVVNAIAGAVTKTATAPTNSVAGLLAAGLLS